MSTQLRDELTRLGEAAPVGVPPTDLWSRGVRRQRRRRAASALVSAAAVLATVLVSTVGWEAVRVASPDPAAHSGDAAIPDRLATPDPFTPSVGDDPIGPLAVIAGAERATGWLGGWLGGTTTGLVGVSATTGEYRFLDLPDAISREGAEFGTGEGPALSPDGRYVGYWLQQREHADRVGGFAVYDTVTGDVLQHSLQMGALGTWADALTWVAPRTLLLTYGRLTERTSDTATGEDVHSRLWTVPDDRLVELEGRPALSSAAPVEGGLAGEVGKGVRLWDVPGAERVGLVAVSSPSEPRELTMSPEGHRVAAAGGASEPGRRLLVGGVDPSGGGVTLQPLRAGVAFFDILGWQDDGHLLVRGAVARQPASAVYTVDVVTGEAQPLVREQRERWGVFPQYASALWAVPTVHRSRPEDVLDPRLRVGVGLGVVLVVVVGVRLVRRRRARA